MRKLVSLLAVLSIAACSSLPENKLGNAVSRNAESFKIQVKSKGVLFVAQKLTAGAPPCFLVKSEMSASFRKEGEPTPEKTDSSCEYLKGYLVVRSQGSVGKGTYLVDVKRTNGIKGFTERPQILAKYDDPDSNSGPDYAVDGAKELAQGSSISGFVSYPEANATDWIRVKGKNAQVALTFVDSSDDGNIQAQVYDASGKKAPRLVGSLSHKKRTMFSVKDDNILVKVSAKGLAGQGAFSLLRGDSGGGAGGGAKGARIGVIDCYATGSGSSIALLRKTNTLKAGTEVTIFGKTADGKMETIGLCQVTSIQGDQASCKMDVGLTQTYVEYRAEAKG